MPNAISGQGPPRSAQPWARGPARTGYTIQIHRKPSRHSHVGWTCRVQAGHRREEKETCWTQGRDMQALLPKPGRSIAGQRQSQRRDSIECAAVKAWPLDQQHQPALGLLAVPWAPSAHREPGDGHTRCGPRSSRPHHTEVMSHLGAEPVGSGPAQPGRAGPPAAATRPVYLAQQHRGRWVQRSWPLPPVKQLGAGQASAADPHPQEF